MTFDYSHQASTRNNISKKIPASTRPNISFKLSLATFKKPSYKQMAGNRWAQLPFFLGLPKGSFQTSGSIAHKECNLNEFPCYFKWTATKKVHGNTNTQYMPGDFSHFQSILEGDNSSTYWSCDFKWVREALSTNDILGLLNANEKIHLLPGLLKPFLQGKLVFGGSVSSEGTLSSRKKVIDSTPKISAKKRPSKEYSPADFTGCFTQWFSEKKVPIYLPGDFNGLFKKWTSSKAQRIYHPGNFVGCSKWFKETSNVSFLPGDFHGLFELWTADVAADEAFLPGDFTGFYDDWTSDFTGDNDAFLPGDFAGFYDDWTTDAIIADANEVNEADDAGEGNNGVFLSGDFTGFYDDWASDPFDADYHPGDLDTSNVFGGSNERETIEIDDANTYLPGDFDGFYDLWTSNDDEAYLPGDFTGFFDDWASEEPSTIAVNPVVENDAQDISTEQSPEDQVDDENGPHELCNSESSSTLEVDDTSEENDEAIPSGDFNDVEDLKVDESTEINEEVNLPGDSNGFFEDQAPDTEVFNDTKLHSADDDGETPKNSSTVIEQAHGLDKGHLQKAEISSDALSTVEKAEDTEGSKEWCLPSDISGLKDYWKNVIVSDDDSDSDEDMSYSDDDDDDDEDDFDNDDDDDYNSVFEFSKPDVSCSSISRKKVEAKVYFPKDFFFLREMFREHSLEVSTYEYLAEFFDMCTKPESPSLNSEEIAPSTAMIYAVRTNDDRYKPNEFTLVFENPEGTESRDSISIFETISFSDTDLSDFGDVADKVD